MFDPTIEDSIKFEFACALDDSPTPATLEIWTAQYPEWGDWFALAYDLTVNAPALPPPTEEELARGVAIGMRAFHRVRAEYAAVERERAEWAARFAEWQGG